MMVFLLLRLLLSILVATSLVRDLFSGRSVARSWSAFARAATCSDLDRYVFWINEFKQSCSTETRSYRSMDWFANCDWVTCNCLYQSLKVPVPLNEVTECYQQGMGAGYLTVEHNQFSLALMQTCSSKTQVKAGPCGECDMYAYERPECGITRANATTVSSLVDPMAPQPELTPMRRPVASSWGAARYSPASGPTFGLVWGSMLLLSLSWVAASSC